MISWLREYWGGVLFGILCVVFFGWISYEIYLEENDPKTHHMRAEDDLHRALHRAGVDHDDLHLQDRFGDG